MRITYSKHVEGVDDKPVLFAGLEDLVDVRGRTEEVRKTLLEFIEDV